MTNKKSAVSGILIAQAKFLPHFVQGISLTLSFHCIFETLCSQIAVFKVFQMLNNSLGNVLMNG